MFNLNKIVRNNILNLKPYSCARDEFSGSDGIFLDANENPFGALNRYPDPYQRELKKKLSEIKSISTENIFVGNGSDEVIDLCFRIFCNQGVDKALTFSPTYGMYQVSADINDVELINLPLNENFQINFTELEKYYEDENLKLIFVCSPNNPTANSIENIDRILEKFNGIVIVDEAYIDFSEKETFSKKINEFPNLIVMQTLSKAWALASLRVGIAYTNSEIISLFNKVKPPYNVSKINQETALKTLENIEEFENKKQIILSQRNFLEKELSKIEIVKKICPSDANFLLIEVTDANKIYNDLVAKKIITRNRNSLVKNCIRITVGTPDENKKLLDELNKI